MIKEFRLCCVPDLSEWLDSGLPEEDVFWGGGLTVPDEFVTSHLHPRRGTDSALPSGWVGVSTGPAGGQDGDCCTYSTCCPSAVARFRYKEAIGPDVGSDSPKSIEYSGCDCFVQGGSVPDDCSEFCDPGQSCERSFTRSWSGTKTWTLESIASTSPWRLSFVREPDPRNDDLPEIEETTGSYSCTENACEGSGCEGQELETVFFTKDEVVEHLASALASHEDYRENLSPAATDLALKSFLGVRLRDSILQLGIRNPVAGVTYRLRFMLVSRNSQTLEQELLPDPILLEQTAEPSDQDAGLMEFDTEFEFIGNDLEFGFDLLLSTPGSLTFG